jgi:hypothetical protein
MTTPPEYFFIIGAMKAGTTSLYNYLAGHPELYPSPKKEPSVFRDPADEADLRARFAALFAGRRDERWCFEGSTSYTKYPSAAGVPRRLRSIVPDARFIYLVRDPAERVWSQYLHNLANGREARPLERAIREDAQYLDVSRYHQQLVQYLEIFPRERILIQVFEEMVKDPEATVRTVCEFLGVDSSYQAPTTDVAFNASGEKIAASRGLRLIRSLKLHDRVPWRLRRRLKDMGTPLPARREILTEPLKKQIVEALGDDTSRFFEILGRRVEWSSLR